MTRTEYNRAVDHFSDGVYRFILKMCKSKEMAEDVVQDSFMKLWEEVGHIAYDKAKSFLFSTAYHRMIDVLRRETKFGDIETVADRAGEVREEYTGLQEILNIALEKLPPVQKTVILLRDYEAYSYGRDCRDHGVERIAGESVHLSGESIYESLTSAGRMWLFKREEI